eukprot:s6440_g1.t1
MQLTRRSGRPTDAAATAEVLFGPVDLPGDTAVMLMAFGSVAAFGSAAGNTIGISVEAFPTLDTVSKTPPGPARRWGPVALGESTDIAGFAGGGEFTDPAGLTGGVFGASTATTLGDPTELFPVWLACLKMTMGLPEWALAFPLVAVWMEVEVELELVEVAVAAWMMEVANSVVGSLVVSVLRTDALWVQEGQIQQP